MRNSLSYNKSGLFFITFQTSKSIDGCSVTKTGVASEDFQFSGNGFVDFEVPRSDRSLETIGLYFKTFQPDGLLLYGEGQSPSFRRKRRGGFIPPVKTYAAFELEGGRLVYKFHSRESTKCEKVILGKYNDGKTYQILKSSRKLTIKYKDVEKESVDLKSQWTLSGSNVYLGGVPVGLRLPW